MKDEISPNVRKEPFGRPTDYRPEFCEQVIELGRQGKSRVQIAAVLDVCRKTLIEWEKEKPDFCDSMTRARELAQAWWEDQGQDGLWDSDARRLNAAAFRFQMINRFPLDWRDRVEQVVQNPDGTSIAPIQIVVRGAELPKAKA